MTTIAETLGTTYFQLSPVGAGALAVGIEDFRQRINNVLGTIPGTDAFRPFFGCSAYLYFDRPLTEAIPNIKKEIFEALKIWITEITVSAITHTIVGDSQLVFQITYAINGSDLTDTVNFSNGSLSGIQGGAGSVIISALVPVQFTNGVYRVILDIDDNPASPFMPSSGFASSGDMLRWLTANWFSYGRWYLTADSLVLYINSGTVGKAVLTVTETTEITIKQLIPLLTAGTYYNLALTVNGVTVTPVFETGTFNTIEGLVSWLNANWGIYGNWSVENTSPAFTGGDFSADFSNDFNNGIYLDALHYLVFQTDTAASATLTFI